MFTSPLLPLVAGVALLAVVVAPRADAQRSIQLPDPSLDGGVSIEETLGKRRSVREFSTASLTLAQLGQLAWAAQGKTAADGRRTAPSAGARHPIEVLVVASRVEGLAAGVYRYVSASHKLARVAEGSRSLSGDLARAALGQSMLAEAPAVIVITGVEERTAGRYGARANRYVMIEAGCVAENVSLQAVGLGLGTVLVGAFDDRRVSTLLNLDRGEQPILLMPVGRER